MPELPEVETVRRGLTPVLEGARLKQVTTSGKALRWPMPADFARQLEGARIERLRRRAKYILMDTDRNFSALVHLGMSGRVRVVLPGESVPPPATHDHVRLVTDGGATVIYNDARRFGAWLPVEADQHPLLHGLGPEPLGNAFHAEALATALEGRRSPIKTALLDQRVVAGLGNIYVAEALFRAGISPRRLALNIGPKRLARLVPAIRNVLRDAIEKGGSSLRDHAQTSGELGYFQHHFDVYDRAGQPCRKPGCSGVVSRIVQSGRSTCYCPRCQH